MWPLSEVPLTRDLGGRGLKKSAIHLEAGKPGAGK
jgi:hypothetical protein